MKIEKLKYIIENKNKIKNLNTEILIKDYKSNLKCFFLIVGGLFEIFGLFITISLLFTNNPIFLLFSMFINFFISYFFIYINKEQLFICFFLKLQKIKILNYNIKEKTEIFNLLMNPEYSNSQIDRIIKYYNSLDEYEKDFFVSQKGINSYVFSLVIKYIKDNNIEYIQKNKEELTNLVFDFFNEEDIKEILTILKNKINFCENKKVEFINVLNKNNKEIIKEI